MNTKLMRTLTIITLLSIGTFTYAESRNSFSFKVGTFDMTNASQTINSSAYVFEAESSSVFAFEYERQLRNNFSIAAGYLQYTNQILSGSSVNQTADSTHFMAIGRKYFPFGRYILPYIGVGVGLSTVTVDGSGFGPGFHGVAGIKFNLKSISLIIETRAVSAKPTDIYNDSLDISGNGVFAGLAFNF